MAIAFVNSFFSGGSASGTSATVGPASLTAGNLLVLIVACKGTGLTVATITDTAGNTFKSCGPGSVDASNYRTEAFYVPNARGNASNTVTVTMNGTVTDLNLATLQYSGAALNTPFDVAVTGAGTGTALTSGSFTPSTTGEVGVAFGIQPSAVTSDTAGTNYTLRDSGTGSAAFLGGEDRLLLPAGAQTATMTANAGFAWQMVVAVFSPTDIAAPVVGTGFATRSAPGRKGPGNNPAVKFQRTVAFLAPDPPAAPVFYARTPPPGGRGPFGKTPTGRFRTALRPYFVPASGTLWTQAVDGTLGNAGDVTEMVGRLLAGSMSSTGVPAKLTSRALAGTAAASGVALKQSRKPVAGSLASSGTFAAVKIVLLAVAGALASSGALLKLVVRPLAGSLGTAGALLKQVQRALAGSLATSGALLRQARKALAGALAPSGALTKRVLRSLSGALAASGALTTASIHVVLLAVAGTLAAAGAISRSVLVGKAGALGAAGAVAKAVRRTAAGALGASGTAVKLVGKALAGALSFLGTLVAGNTSLPIVGPAIRGIASFLAMTGRAVRSAMAGRRTSTPVAGKRAVTPLRGSASKTNLGA